MENKRCNAITIKGDRCKLRALPNDNSSFCHRHAKIRDAGRKVKYVSKNNQDNQNIQNNQNNQNNRTLQIVQKYGGDYMTDQEFEEYIGIFRINNVNNQLNNQLNNKQNNLVIEQDEYLKKIPKNPPKQNQLTKQIIEIIPLDPSIQYECQCCFTEYPFEDLIKCSNASATYKHVFCKDCIKGYIEAGMNDKKSNCQCMLDTKDENCKGVYLESDIEKCLSVELMKNFKDMLIVSTVTSFAKMINGYQICPFCNMYGLIIEGNIKYVKCNRCKNKSWCVLCRREAHANDPCWKIKDENDKDAIIYAVTETLTNALVHECPVCHSKYIKEEGCNLMTCSACKSYSCYLCGIKLVPRGDDKYWHFYGNGGLPTRQKTCVLFNDSMQIGLLQNQGNTKFNNDKVIAECKKLLNANNKAVQNIMKIEMKKQGVDVDKGKFENKINKPINKLNQQNNRQNNQQNNQQINRNQKGWLNNCLIS